MSRDPATMAAGCASHVGYQKERTSRRVWYREPAPPSNPSYEGGFKNSVFSISTFPCAQSLAAQGGTERTSLALSAGGVFSFRGSISPPVGPAPPSKERECDSGGSPS